MLPPAVRMGRYIRQHRIELVHSFDTPGNLFAVPVARAFRTPVVLSSQRAFRTLAKRIDHHFLRIIDRMVDAVVVNCRQVEKHLVDDEGVAAGQIRLCYNGIDTNTFFPAPEPRPEALRDASLVIGTVGALRPEKGLDTLAEAFARVHQSSPGIHLVMVGSGRMLETLESMRARSGLAANWSFVPSTRDVVPWLRSIDIFVLPSLSEALSNSLMEALACGCAAIASRVGGNIELVEEGKTGLLFEPADAGSLAHALDTLIGRPDLRRRMGMAAAHRIRTGFSREKAAAEMAAIYDSFFEN
jgi:glycosyltransferase involved in cell wall biosynthesis